MSDSPFITLVRKLCPAQNASGRPFHVNHGSTAVLLGILLFAFLWTSHPVFSAEHTVVRIVADGPVDASMRHFLRSRLHTADRDRTSHILLELQSRSGRIDYVLDVADVIDRIDTPVTIYVSGPLEGPAIMLGFSGDRLFMHANARMQYGPPGSGSTRSTLFREGYVAQLANRFASIAERNNYPGTVARAMINPDITLKWVPDHPEKFISGDRLDELRQTTDISVRESINPSGERLSLSPGDANRFGLSEQTVSRAKDLLSTLPSKPGLQVSLQTINWPFTHTITRCFTGYMSVALLIILGTVTGLLEIRRPGTGWAGFIAVLCFSLPVLIFASLDLVSPPILVLLLLGLSAFALDTILIPGISILGFLGFVPVISSLILSRNSFLLPNVANAPWDVKYLFDSFSICLLSLGAGIVIYSVFVHVYSDWLFTVTLVRASTEGAGRPDPAFSPDRLIGAHGTVQRAVRPIGTIHLQGRRTYVVTKDFYLEPGTEIEIIDVEGLRLTARIK